MLFARQVELECTTLCSSACQTARLDALRKVIISDDSLGFSFQGTLERERRQLFFQKRLVLGVTSLIPEGGKDLFPKLCGGLCAMLWLISVRRKRSPWTITPGVVSGFHAVAEEQAFSYLKKTIRYTSSGFVWEDGCPYFSFWVNVGKGGPLGHGLCNLSGCPGSGLA